MMAHRILIACYSMTGNTVRLAEEIRAAFSGDADLERIAEPRPRHGLFGALRALSDAVLRRDVPISPIDHDPAGYALLILGGPVWAGRLASPVRTYARRHAAAAARVAFFCTQGGGGADAAFGELGQLCGHTPCATLAVDARHLDAAAHRDALVQFTTAARSAMA